MNNRRIDTWLALIVLILIIGGMLMVFSASAVGNTNIIGAEFKYLFRQGAALTVGLGLCWIASMISSSVWRGIHWYFYGMCMFGLWLCFSPVGHASHGAARWFGFGSVNFQPSAFAKIAVLISLSAYLHKWRGHVHQLPVLLKALPIPAAMLFFIIIEPDFGTTLIISSLSFAMLIIAGMAWRHVLITGGTLLFVGTIVLFSADYRVRRMLTFWDPWSVKEGEGYQVVQSFIAMHNGGLTGQGLGNSLAKRQFLPEPWTDFIGSVIAEEMGFIGLSCVMLLFCAFLWRGLHIAAHAKDAFSMFLATTLTIMIVGEAFFNLGVIMGVVPPKGLVLPFISYGSSAMMANMFAVGILLGISAERKDIPLEQGWKTSPTIVNALTDANEDATAFDLEENPSASPVEVDLDDEQLLVGDLGVSGQN